MPPALGKAVTVTGWVAVALPQLLVTVYMMVSMPPLMPVTTPETETVALPLDALQVPPGARSARGIVAPVHTADSPVMVPAVRKGPMVTTLVTDAVPQALVTVYLIVSVPGVMPVSRPAEVIVAVALVTLQVPPGVASE